MTYNVFSGTLNPTQSTIALCFVMCAVWLCRFSTNSSGVGCC